VPRVNEDSAALLELLACVACRGALKRCDGGLVCCRCGREYSVRRRVPVLFPDETETGVGGRGLLARLQHSVLAHSRVYDVAQKYGRGRVDAEELTNELKTTAGQTLLDVGAGTGTLMALLPPGTQYMWFDNDMLKLAGLLSKDVDCFAVLGDAARLPLRDSAVEVVVIVDVSHHLPAPTLRESLAEAARVARDRLVFVDAVRSKRLKSRLLWKCDLGKHPRSEDELVRAIDRSFDVQKVERFRVHHDYVLCVGTPRTG
jgi:SAM-dependent methyltransferase/uncharacterized protein YbaR (Trm112 family)